MLRTFMLATALALSISPLKAEETPSQTTPPSIHGDCSLHLSDAASLYWPVTELTVEAVEVRQPDTSLATMDALMVTMNATSQKVTDRSTHHTVTYRESWVLEIITYPSETMPLFFHDGRTIVERFGKLANVRTVTESKVWAGFRLNRTLPLTVPRYQFLMVFNTEAGCRLENLIDNFPPEKLPPSFAAETAAYLAEPAPK